MAYTPGVAEPCREIEKNDDDVYKYTAKGNLVAVVSNGTAVLGLGDIGPHAGKPVPEKMQDKLRNTYRRTHRWEKIERHEDVLAVSGNEDLRSLRRIVRSSSLTSSMRSDAVDTV